MDDHQLQEFKRVKRRLSAIQRIIKDDLKENRLPQSRDANDFIATSKEMNDFCLNEWRADMNAYMVLLDKFQAVASGEDIEKIKNAFRKLLDSKVSCHKAFR